MHEHDVDPDTRLRSHAADDRHTADGPDAAIGRGARSGRVDTLGPHGVLALQRAAGNTGVAGLVGGQQEEESPVKAVVRSTGSALDADTRQTMETALGHDFGDVQVHHDATASESARSVGAQAYTVGNHVVFDEGRYRPDSPDGQRTLAHELTHVVQQREGPVDGTPAAGGIRVSDPSDRFEQEAERTAARVTATSSQPPATSAGSGPVDAGHGTGGLQRQTADEEREPAGPPDAVPPETDEDATAAQLAVQRETGEDEEEEAPS